MNNVLNKSIREDIFEAITSIWGLNILDFTIVDLGYMNLKWILKTDHGDFFAKQYNKSRYPEHMVEGFKIRSIIPGYLVQNYILITANM